MGRVEQKVEMVYNLLDWLTNNVGVRDAKRRR